MKRIHRTMLTAVLLLGGGGGALVYTLSTRVKPREERFREAEDQKRLFRFGRMHVLKGVLRTRSATVSFERDPEREWRITSPVRWPAEPAAIEAMLDQMAALKLDPVLTEDASPEELALHGLASPAMSLEVELKEGKETLFVGRRNKLVDQYPVTDGAKERIGLTEPSFYPAMDRPLDDLRDRRVFAFTDSAVKRVRVIDSGRVTLELSREGETWSASGGSETYEADAGTVGLFLVAMTKRLRVVSFLDDAVEADDLPGLARYGLGPEERSIEIETSSGITRARFGAFRHGGVGEARPALHLGGTTSVVETSPHLLEELSRTPLHFRDRTFARFDRERVTKVRFEVGGPAIVVEKAGAEWRITAPQAAPAKVWKMDDIVRSFSILRAAKIHSDRPSPAQLREWLLEPPSRRLVFYGPGDEVLADVRIGSYATEEALFLTAEGVDRVGMLTTQRVAMLPKSANDLIDD